MDDTERRNYIFENQNGNSIVDNRFGWLEGALLGDIQTFVNTIHEVPQLVIGAGNLSLPIIICTGLEMAAGMYTCNTRYLSGSSYNAEDNVRNFIKDFFIGRIREIPRLIWDEVRNGVDHFFVPKPFRYTQQIIRFSFDIENASVISALNNGPIVININGIEFYQALVQAIQRYRIRLQDSILLQRRFIIAWESI